MNRRFLLLVLVSTASVLAACAGPSLVVVGDPVRPAPEIPQLEVAVVDELGAAVPDVMVNFSGTTVPTDSQGSAFSPWPDQAVTVQVSAPGFHPATQVVTELPEFRRVEVPLAPVVLSGTVQTGEGFNLDGVTLTLGDAEVQVSDQGTFEVNRAEPGVLVASRPGYEDVSLVWEGASDVVSLSMEPQLIRSVRSTGPGTGTDAWIELLELVGRTELNAVVVDAKDEGGQVFFGTELEGAYTAGAVTSTFDVEAAVADLDAREIYSITRVVTFKDNNYARAFPDLAVQSESGGVWEDSGGQAWLDASNPDAWEYPLEMAEELCDIGFDEIQFDYVRFPTDGNLNTAVFTGSYDENSRVAAIAGFLGEARNRLNPKGCAVAADIFSVVLSTPDDQGLGQRLEELSTAVDVFLPMVYASHYTSGWFGYECPNEFPGQVVGFALDDALARIETPVVIRPWIEDFPFLSGDLKRAGCTSTHSSATVRAQIDAAESRAHGWILWNARGNYSENALVAE